MRSTSIVVCCCSLNLFDNVLLVSFTLPSRCERSLSRLLLIYGPPSLKQAGIKSSISLIVLAKTCCLEGSPLCHLQKVSSLVLLTCSQCLCSSVASFQKLQYRVCAAHVAYEFFVHHPQCTCHVYTHTCVCTPVSLSMSCPLSTPHRIARRLSEQVPRQFCHFVVSKTDFIVFAQSFYLPLFVLQETCVAKSCRGCANPLEYLRSY